MAEEIMMETASIDSPFLEKTEEELTATDEVSQHENSLRKSSNQYKEVLAKLEKASLLQDESLHNEIEDTVRNLRNGMLAHQTKQTYTLAVKHEDEIQRQMASGDYHVVRAFITLFLAKEKFIDDEIRKKGDEIAKLHQLLNSLIKLSNSCNKDELPEDAIELVRELNGKVIHLPYAGEDKSNKITIRFSKDKDFDKEAFLKEFDKDAFRSVVFTYMDQTKLGIQQWFTALQDDVTSQMACLEIVKASLKTGDPIRKFVENQQSR